MQKFTYDTLAATTRNFEDLTAACGRIGSLLEDDNPPEIIRPLLDMLRGQGDEIYGLYTGDTWLEGPFDEEYGRGSYLELVDNVALDFINIVEDYLGGDSGEYFITASDYYHLGERLHEFTIRLTKTVGLHFCPGDIKRECRGIEDAIEPKFLPRKYRNMVIGARTQLSKTGNGLAKKYGDDPECYICLVNALMGQVTAELARIAHLNPNNMIHNGAREGLEKRTQGYIKRMCRLTANFTGKVHDNDLNPAFNHKEAPRAYIPGKELHAVAQLTINLANDMWQDWHLEIDPDLIEEVEPIMVHQRYLDKYAD